MILNRREYVIYLFFDLDILACRYKTAVKLTPPNGGFSFLFWNTIAFHQTVDASRLLAIARVTSTGKLFNTPMVGNSLPITNTNRVVYFVAWELGIKTLFGCERSKEGSPTMINSSLSSARSTEPMTSSGGGANRVDEELVAATNRTEEPPVASSGWSTLVYRGAPGRLI